MQHQHPHTLQGDAIRAPTVNDRFSLIIRALYATGLRSFETVAGVEDKLPEFFETEPVDPETVYGFIADQLTAHDVPTKRTLGSIARSLDVTQLELHEIACSCDSGPLITGAEAALNVHEVQGIRAKRLESVSVSPRNAA